MPMYTVSSPSALPNLQKEQLAHVIMNTHCRLTGAPETFVNVIFSEQVPLQDAVELNILGNVRKGRTPEMSLTLVQQLRDAIIQLLSLSETQLQLSLFEIPASWVMEGGEVLPEPGEEAECEWLQNQ